MKVSLNIAFYCYLFPAQKTVVIKSSGVLNSRVWFGIPWGSYMDIASGQSHYHDWVCVFHTNHLVCFQHYAHDRISELSGLCLKWILSSLGSVKPCYFWLWCGCFPAVLQLDFIHLFTSLHWMAYYYHSTAIFQHLYTIINLQTNVDPAFSL